MAIMRFKRKNNKDSLFGDMETFFDALPRGKPITIVKKRKNKKELMLEVDGMFREKL